MMGQGGIMNSHGELQLVYKEEVVPVEFVPPGAQECLVCVMDSVDIFNIFSSRTTVFGTPVYSFLSKFTNTELPFSPDFAKYICRRCLQLVNVLENAEVEYVKLKTTFEQIISRNPLFHLPVQSETTKEQNPLDSGDDESDLMNKNTEIYISVEGYPVKETCNDGNTVYIQEPMLAGSNSNSEDELGNSAAKSFLGEDTDDEYSPGGKQRSQSKKTGPKCTICRRRFSCKRNLQRHLEIHFDKKSYECHICQRRFNVHAYLKTHLKTHGVIYECNVCHYQFNVKGDYVSHMATHSVEAPYECSFCSRRFKYKGQLRYHLRVHASEKLKYEDNVYKLLCENGDGLIDDSLNPSSAEELNTYVPAVEAEAGNHKGMDEI